MSRPVGADLRTKPLTGGVGTSRPKDPQMSAWTHHRARVASLSQFRDDDDPDLIAARFDLAAARLGERIGLELGRLDAEADQVDQLVLGAAAAMPPLSPVEVDALCKLAAELRARCSADAGTSGTP